MKITKLETFHVRPRWLFLKIHTDEGIVGYGEPVLEGRARTVETAIKEFERYLIGQDPMLIEHHWQVMYRGGFYRGGPVILSAISGIEQALWDIKGKYYNMPVYEMLGGACRNKIRMYTHVKQVGIKNGNSIDQMVEMARERKEQGYTAIKYSIIPPIRNIDTLAAVEEHVERFARVREAIGKDIDLAIDFHGRVSPAMAIRLAKALEPYYPMFIEEPCLPENVDAMVRIAQSTTIPIAAGERLFTKWGYRELLEKQAVAVVQPDLCHVGGILEAKKIAAMAEVYYRSVAPHNPLGPISLAACLQLDACIPNFLFQEHPGMPEKWDLGEGYLKNPFVIVDGYIPLPRGPGLGIELDEEAMKDKIFDGIWETPLLYEEDGSLADW
ncbi:galactonate dehydratase [Paenibacillus nasutitermitis]|uniref:Galactonate dehydratase n=1 Tax=Paenibacillus nasutitermitis TaxID=1652958 RepID=A0A917E484_9BACL|nr:galactonate dehydratase [Paenibacillus nasutitermitis]GGE02126.1 galactonate dehydratase [Paenibacillus nasutitermitis]